MKTQDTGRIDSGRATGASGHGWPDAAEGGQGRAGDDILAGSVGAERMHGGGGTDTVDYSTSPEGVAVILNRTDGWGISFEYPKTSAGGHGGMAEGDRYASVETVIASQHDDLVYGSARGTTAWLLDGNDVFDTRQTSPAADSVHGGAGDDSLWGGGGADTLAGGAGDDSIFGEDGGDLLLAGPGLDKLDGGAGDDMLVGAAPGTSGHVYSVALHQGSVADYTITGHVFAAGTPEEATWFTVADNRDGSPEGTDTLLRVSVIEFADKVVDLLHPTVPLVTETSPFGL
ncbi:calcium-binding protein [Roseicella aquatilis]|uniref:Calcium-binding protein n=1 Tax=Roseicella aquatilis TaxID=2527868 RepID=A0A4R4DW12_9PROT|nr:calcium-binding protein [Roseicella aquatilis]TCZ66721.1 calcium-binding protein [Roseicella aquatilis]